MQKYGILFFSFLYFTIGSSFGQIQQPYEICQTISERTYTQSEVTQCTQLISQNQIDLKVVPLLVKMAKKSTYQSLLALKVSINKLFDLTGVKTCEQLVSKVYQQSDITNCLKVVSNKRYDPLLISILSKMVNKSTYQAVEILKIADTIQFDPMALSICEKLMSKVYQQSDVTSCIKSIKNKYFNPDLETILIKLVNKSTFQAQEALKKLDDSYLNPVALAACEEITDKAYQTSDAIKCLGVIKNKEYMNGAASLCKNIIRNSIHEAMNCLKVNGVEYIPPTPTPGPFPNPGPNPGPNPTPGPTPIPNPTPLPDGMMEITFEEFKLLRKSNRKAMRQLSNGQIQRAIQTLQNQTLLLDDIKKANAE
ncbi:hypothetical protein N9N67_09250 [Bacteriovoracaceae bacterium]|nr:hypothetical protein [Bacteriovoracaceae bacterium]